MIDRYDELEGKLEDYRVLDREEELRSLRRMEDEEEDYED